MNERFQHGIRQGVKSVLFFLVIIFAGGASSISDEFIMPTNDFNLNFINCPQAWQLSKGNKVLIGLVVTGDSSAPEWSMKVKKVASEAEISVVVMKNFLSRVHNLADYQVFIFTEQPDSRNYKKILKAIKYFSEFGAIVVIPAYFGPMKKETDYSGWREFVRAAYDMGAVITGIHGINYQLGNISFWESIPVDIFTLHEKIGSWNYYGYDSLIEQNLEESAYLTGGAIALLKGLNPEINSFSVKEMLKERGRTITWNVAEGSREVLPFWNGKAMEEFESNVRNKKIIKAYTGSCLDAGMLLGMKPLTEGEWCFNTLEIEKAHGIATGTGVTVAILDWLFVPDDPSLKTRTVKPGSVVPDSIFDERNPHGHGTWMARELVKAAPGVNIMPVRILSFERDKNYTKDKYPANLIKGIEYAVSNGADIISISHRSVGEEWYDRLDAAVHKAGEAGVTIVYIHYYGENDDVIVTRPIEFAEKEGNVIYVIGTGFISGFSFPNTWGFSQTAPVVSGVIAMMKEINPSLSPVDIKDILSCSGRQTDQGFDVLSAFKALQSCKN